METLRAGPQMRGRAFDAIEWRHARELGSGTAGMRLYDDLFSAVRDAGVPEAVHEFERRFLPFINASQGARQSAVRRFRRAALYMTALTVGISIVGLNFPKLTALGIAETPIAATESPTEQPRPPSLGE
jgi:hypothetical protein